LFPVENSPEGCATGECLPELEARAEPEARAAVPEPARPAAPAGSTPAPALDNGLQSDRWRGAVDAVKARSSRHGASLAFGRLVSLREGWISLAFTREASFHRATVAGTGRPIIEQALTEHFGRPTRVELQDDTAGAGPSIAEQDAQVRETRERGAEAKAKGHPAVLAALRVLGGELEHIRVLEPEAPPSATEPDLPEDR
jgi:hypothetical protein